MTDNGRDEDDQTARQPLSEGPPDQSAPSESGPGADVTSAAPWLTAARESGSADYSPWQPPPAPAPASSVGEDTAIFGPETDGSVGRPRRRGRALTAVGAAAVVIAIAAVAAVALSGSPAKKPLTPHQILAAAVHNEARLTSVSATVSERVSGPVSVELNASVQAQIRPLRLSVRLSESVAAQHIPITMIANSSAMYLKLGAALPGIPSAARGKWLKLPFAELGPSSPFASLQQSLQNANPASQTRQLLALTHLHAEGPATVDGVSTTKYEGSFAPSAALKELPASQRAQLAPVMNQIKGDVAVSVWIDGQKQIRKLTETEEVAGSTVALTMTINSYNQPVHIAFPSAGQVIVPPAGEVSGGSPT